MRLCCRQGPLPVLLLPLFACSFVVAVSEAAADAASARLDVASLAKPPVDGKDGKPHAGPFVETAAERDRKLAKISGDEDTPAKPLPTALRDVPLTVASDDDDAWTLVPDMPESNDGVMNDPNRAMPKEGTTGTEGGVSEKSKNTKAQDGLGSKPEKRPDPPKEVPPLPHSEQEKIDKESGELPPSNNKVGGLVNDAYTRAKPFDGLEKPTDLPEKPHDIPHPLPPSSNKEDALRVDEPKSQDAVTAATAATAIGGAGTEEGIMQPLHSFFLSFCMIIVSEIGDKTFLIAALMAMKHPRTLVFSAAFSALIVMTILSAIFGHAVPTLIPQQYTHLAAGILFLVFGVKLLHEARAMSPDETPSEEMKEVEMELEEKATQTRRMSRRRSSISPYVLEAGRAGARKSRSNSRLPSPPASPSSSSSRSPSPRRLSSGFYDLLAGFHNLFSLLLSPAWVQTFVMTFLGEWGDRSQIATIAMAAGQDYWWVTVGALVGHGCCTGGAVIGGRAIAGRVSLRAVTMGGAIAFLFFALVYFVETVY